MVKLSAASFFIIIFFWTMQWVYPLFMIYINDVVLTKTYEKDGGERPVTKKFIGKTYALEHDIILVQYDPYTAMRLVPKYEMKNDEIIPIPSDLNHANYWARIKKGTNFTIKKVMIEALRFQGELPIPKLYAQLVGYEEEGLINVDQLFFFDYDYFDEKQKVMDRQIVIMESTTPDSKWVHQVN